MFMKTRLEVGRAVCIAEYASRLRDYEEYHAIVQLRSVLCMSKPRAVHAQMIARLVGRSVNR